MTAAIAPLDDREGQLDRALADLNRHRDAYSASIWDQGRVLAMIRDRELWRERRRPDGSEAYSGWEEFLASEVALSRPWVAMSLRLFATFDRETVERLGPSRLDVIRRAPEGDRPRLLATAERGATTKELLALLPESVRRKPGRAPRENPSPEQARKRTRRRRELALAKLVRPPPEREVAADVVARAQLSISIADVVALLVVEVSDEVAVRVGTELDERLRRQARAAVVGAVRALRREAKRAEAAKKREAKRAEAAAKRAAKKAAAAKREAAATKAAAAQKLAESPRSKPGFTPSSEVRSREAVRKAAVEAALKRTRAPEVLAEQARRREEAAQRRAEDRRRERLEAAVAKVKARLARAPVEDGDDQIPERPSTFDGELRVWREGFVAVDLVGPGSQRMIQTPAPWAVDPDVMQASCVEVGLPAGLSPRRAAEALSLVFDQVALNDDERLVCDRCGGVATCPPEHCPFCGVFDLDDPETTDETYGEEDNR